MLFYSIFLVAMFAAIVLIPPLTYVYNKYGLVDMPSARKVHTIPVPRVGGVAIVLATVAPLLVWLHLSTAVLGLLVGVAVLFVLGIIDDAKNLGYKSKFIVQIASVVLILATGFIDVSQSHFVVKDLLPVAAVLALYFIFILGVTNAINLADGLDGLAGGEALLSFSIIGLLAYEADYLTIVMIVLAILGAVFGFLRFNTYPAKIFMGDTGSLFLGFILGVLSVALTYSADNAYAKALPLLLVGLPIFDTLMVMVIRLRHKQSPFNADRNHLHHKLLDNGYKHYQSVLIIYLIQSVYIMTAYFMRYDTEINIVIAFVTISVLVMVVSVVHKNPSEQYIAERSVLNKFYKFVKTVVVNNDNTLFKLLLIFLLVYIASSLMGMADIRIDGMLVLIGISVIAIIGLVFFKHKPCTWIERIAIHIMIVISIYFSAQSDNGSSMSVLHMSVLFASVGVIALLFLGDGTRKFTGSPLDFLLVATAMVIPNLPRSPISDPNMSMLVIKLIVLFYCIEYVLFNIKRHWWAIRATLAMTAGVPVLVHYIL